MNYYVLKPEVAGGFGPKTIFLSPKARPPLIEKFNYEFFGWAGDPILTSVSSYIVTDDLKSRLEAMGATGISFGEVEISTAGEFDDWQKLSPKPELPPFVWLQVNGVPTKDDFGFTTSGGIFLVVSERVLDLFIECGMKQGKMVELDNWNGITLSDFRRTK